MTNEEKDQTGDALPPHVKLIQMSSAFLQSRVLYTAAKLELADYLSDGPKRADELAEPTGTHASSLHRLMRTLAHLGVLLMEDGQRFSLTPLGEALKSDAPGAAQSTILTGGRERTKEEYDELLEKTGFDLERVVPTDSPVSIVEAVPS